MLPATAVLARARAPPVDTRQPAVVVCQAVLLVQWQASAKPPFKLWSIWCSVSGLSLPVPVLPVPLAVRGTRTGPGAAGARATGSATGSAATLAAAGFLQLDVQLQVEATSTTVVASLRQAEPEVASA